MNHYEALATMPEDVRDVALLCYDDTGRPNHDNSYAMALGRLMDLCKDWEEFKLKYSQMFYDDDISDYKLTDSLSTAWHCYIRGMLRVTYELEKMKNV